MAKQKFTEQLTAFLLQHPSERLAEWLAETVASDKSLKKQWQIIMLLSGGKPSDYKKLLTQALPRKDLIGVPNMWHKVGAYFAEAEDLLALAFAQLDNSDTPLTNEQQFTWLLQAFERLNYVLEQIDDSGGYRLDLEAELGARLVHCFYALDWPVDKKANWLLEYRYKYDVFPYIPAQFELKGELAAVFARLNAEKEQEQTQADKLDNVSMALLNRLKDL